MDDPMEIDGLGPAAKPGLKGISSGLLERLEREARAQAAEAEQVQRQLQRPKAQAGNSGSSSAKRNAAEMSSEVGGYVPGGKKAAAEKAASANVNSTASTSNAAAAISSAAPVSNDATASGSELQTKKPRIQPTIRMQFSWKPYPVGQEPHAKHVPIFDILAIAEKQGFLLPPEETIEEGSSSGGSDDDDDDDKAEEEGTGGEASGSGAQPSKPGSAANQALKAALQLASKSAAPLVLRKRILERDEGYDVDDPFVDDSELAVNEPKFQHKPLMEGYIAQMGLVGTFQDEDGGGAKTKGRKAGSLNKPKVPIQMPDGSTKMVSEAVAARKQKKADGKNATSSSDAKAAPEASTSNGVAKPSSTAEPAISRQNSGSRPPNSTNEARSPPPSAAPRTSATPYSGVGNGSRMSPIAIDDNEDDVEGSATPAPTGKKTQHIINFDPSPAGRKKYEYEDPDSKLQASLDVLRKAISRESFENKKKFPPDLKPLLVNTAIIAIETNEYNDNFFNIMPNIFPYNRFTMQKLIKREVCEPRVNQLEAHIDEEMRQLKEEVDKAVAQCLPAYEEALKKYEVDLAEYLRKNPTATPAAGQAGTTPASKDSSVTPHNDSTANKVRANSLTPVPSDGDTTMADGTAQNDQDQANGATKEAGGMPVKPKPKFKWNDALRQHLFAIMTYQNEITQRLRDKAEVEKAEEPSQLVASKQRYSKIVPLWPDGWMFSNVLSRELTQFKRRVEKAATRT